MVYSDTAGKISRAADNRRKFGNRTVVRELNINGPVRFRKAILQRLKLKILTVRKQLLMFGTPWRIQDKSEMSRNSDKRTAKTTRREVSFFHAIVRSNEVLCDTHVTSTCNLSTFRLSKDQSEVM